MNVKIAWIASSLAALLLVACGSDDPSAPSSDAAEHGHAHEGAHGGHLLEIGAVGHVEVVHDATAGTLTLHVTGPDAKTPLSLEAAPEVLLPTDAGSPLKATATELPVEPARSAFELRHDELRSVDLRGRLRLRHGGELFQLALEHDH